MTLIGLRIVIHRSLKNILLEFETLIKIYKAFYNTFHNNDKNTLHQMIYPAIYIYIYIYLPAFLPVSSWTSGIVNWYYRFYKPHNRADRDAESSFFQGIYIKIDIRIVISISIRLINTRFR